MHLRMFALGALTGAALLFILDPDRGRRRRAMARDRFTGARHRAARRARRLGRRTAAEAYGLKQKATHLRPEDKGTPDDVTLAHTVQSEVFRDPRIPKDRITLSAQDGCIVLRGQVDRLDQIRDVEQKVRRVHGVREVTNLLHLRGTPAPNKADALTADHTPLNERLPHHAGTS
jgi:BON domain